MIEEITECPENSNKIESLKTYLKATGQGLKESKKFIDQPLPGLVERDSTRFSAIAKGTDCSTAVFVLLCAVSTSTFAIEVTMVFKHLAS